MLGELKSKQLLFILPFTWVFSFGRFPSFLSNPPFFLDEISVKSTMLVSVSCYCAPSGNSPLGPFFPGSASPLPATEWPGSSSHLAMEIWPEKWQIFLCSPFFIGKWIGKSPTLYLYIYIVLQISDIMVYNRFNLWECVDTPDLQPVGSKNHLEMMDFSLTSRRLLDSQKDLHGAISCTHRCHSSIILKRD